MKRILIFTLLFFCLSSALASGANRIIVSSNPVDSLANNNDSIEIIIGWENDVLLQGVSNGFILNLSGNVTCEIDSGSAAIIPGSRLDGALGWNFRYGYAPYDSILMGGIYMPGTYEGVPVGAMIDAWSFAMSIGYTGGTMESDTGHICVDSAFIPPAGYWIWDDGSGNLQPSYNDGNGNYCIKIFPYICYDTDNDGYGDPGHPNNECPLDNCPMVYNPDQVDSDGDEVGDSCDLCPGFDDNLDTDGDGMPDDCDVCPGYDDFADADSDGVPDGCDICPNHAEDNCCNPIGSNQAPFVTSGTTVTTTPGQGPFEYIATGGDNNCDGTELIISFADYPSWCTVSGDTIRGSADCDFVDTSFTVIVSDSDLDATLQVSLLIDKSNQPPVIQASGDTVFVAGSSLFTYSPVIADPDDTYHSIEYPVIPHWCSVVINSVNGTAPDSIITEPLTVIARDFCNADTLSFFVSVYLCGDANRDEAVNVSDAVYIINYVFVGGDAPYPIGAGDANCDATVNVSDAVWIINYVFVGGDVPCDTDGDGEPDC